MEDLCEDSLQNNIVCPINIDTAISIVPADTPAQCQALCYQTPGCSYFNLYSLASSNTSSSSCALLRNCKATKSSFALSSAVGGPREPAIADACCSKFGRKACNGYPKLVQFNVDTAEECQHICEKTDGCNYFTQYGKDLCMLYKSCHSKEMVECSMCTSGPVRPAISTCQDTPDNQATLIIGGKTDSGGTYSTSIEMVKEDEVCTPELPELPSGVSGASAVLLDSTILHCGGYGAGVPHYRVDCYQYILGQGQEQWKRAPSMNYPRTTFSLSVYNGKAFAVGGTSDYGAETSGSVVEVYTPGQGWEVHDSMALNGYRYGHCSAVLDGYLMILGGNYGGSAYSPTVRVLNLKTMQGWYTRTSMYYGRQYHSCQVAPFQGQEGVFVAGGSNKDHSLVEFYAPSVKRWRKLSPLNTGREYHTSSFISGSLYIHGGKPSSTGIIQETLNDTLVWSSGPSLGTTRYDHASVAIPANLVNCLDN